NPLFLFRRTPTQMMSGRAALIAMTTARSSARVISRNGGQNVPTTCSPGTDLTTVSFSFSATSLRALPTDQTQEVYQRDAVGRYHAGLVVDLSQQRITAALRTSPRSVRRRG